MKTAPLPEAGWDQIREEALASPGQRARYERTRQATRQTRLMLQRIDSERERAGLTKGELATLAGMDPSAVRRLFTSSRSNPTLHTVLSMMAALGIEVEFKVQRFSRSSRQSASPDLRRREVATA